MKRLTSLLAALVALASTASAQIQFGVEAGASIKKISFSKDIYNADNCTGFFVGPKVKAIIPILGLGADAAVLYAQNKTVVDGAEKKHMNYVRVPVNIRWDFNPSFVGAFITTGPQWDWYIGNSKLYTSEGLKATFEHNVINWNIGAGFILLDHLELGASYSIPLSKAGSTSEIFNGIRDNIDLKNNEWQVRLNYFF